MTYDLKGFVDQLFVEKGRSGLDPDVLEQMKEDLSDRIENIINSQILENLPANSLEKFEELLDGGSDSEVQAFCNEKIPNLDEIVAKVLSDFRKQYLGR